MQLIFFTSLTPEEYYSMGREFPFPRPLSCPNPKCLLPIPPKPHGFYTRNCFDENFSGRILIRRYYCPHCGMTFSCLPSFCLPYFQYSLRLIFLAIFCFFNLSFPHLRILSLLKSELSPHILWDRQHLAFYTTRFLANLKAIQLGLRQLLPWDVPLPEETMDKKKRAKKVLAIVQSGFREIHSFSQRFFAQCRRSFLAPVQNILA